MPPKRWSPSATPNDPKTVTRTERPRLEDLIDLPPGCADPLRPWQPALAYHLLELVRIPYGELAGTPEGILTLRALKAEPVDELLSDALWYESLWFSVSEGPLERLLRYIFNAEQQVPKLRERIRKIQTQPLKHKAMTLADQLRSEGKLEGKIEGQQEGLTEASFVRCGRPFCAPWRSATAVFRKASGKPSGL